MEPKSNKKIKRLDPHSYSEPEITVVKHLDLKLKVDFNTHILNGVAVWTIQNISKSDEIIFDTNGLNIEKITLNEGTENAFFVLGDLDKILGQSLRIQIKPDTKTIHIFYSTRKDAAAIQWLNPQQTEGKKMPFMFTQSQAILARSWLPTQDSPSIRFTYNAEIEVPKEFLPLMSAENPQQKNNTGIYHFKQVNPIPSYLMALAVGDIVFKKIDNRTGIYAEPAMLNKAVYEFADIGKMVTTAEKLYGKYLWGRYDVLVLPPSFPFGGMENPMLTFATPTVIAGDRSLVSLIAHELAHSWSGNLVTNANWNDFWLNEGFTNYFERRILEQLYGKEAREMQEVLAYADLKETINELGKNNPDTRLKVDFTGRNPDDGVSAIPYEKGYFFLKSIENGIGREKFDVFINHYFTSNAFTSITTDKFLNILNKEIIKDDTVLNKKINSYAWVYQPGLPKDFVAPISANFAKIDTEQTFWRTHQSLKGLSAKIKSTDEKLYFIRTLPTDITIPEMEMVDKEFNFTISGNAELESEWFTLAAQKGYKIAYGNMENFLINVGRRKFILPIYKALIKRKDGKKLAQEIYKKARPNYHSVTYNTLDEMLK
jgi:leukotriene-A4 hydrolase